MSVMKTVSLVLLLCITQSVYCNRTIQFQMIADYVLNQEVPKSITVVFNICWKTYEKYKLAKFLFERNYSVRLASSSEPISNDLTAAHTSIHIADLQCNNVKYLLNKANENNMLTGPFRWLLLSNDPDVLYDQISYFTNYDIYPNSNIVIAQKIEKNEFILSEMYRYNKSNKELVLKQIANWTKETKFRDFKPRILARERQNLNGSLLRVSVVIIDNDTVNHLEDFRNPHVDSISKLNFFFAMLITQFLNATPHVIYVDTWGYNNNSGMVGDLCRGDAELGGSTLFITQERIPIIDFASCTTSSKIRFVFRRPPLSYESNIFTLPFTRSLWISSMCLLLLIIILLYMAVHLEWQYQDLEMTDAPLQADFMEVVMLEIGGLAQQGATHEPRSGSGKIIMIFSYIALLFLYVSYSANIVALLQSSTKNIKTLDNMLESRMKLGVHDTPYNRHYFTTATDPVRKAIYEQKIAPPNQPAQFMSLEEGIRRVRKGFFAFNFELGPGYKIISETFFESEKCDLQEISYFIGDGFYLPMKKNSVYKEMIRIGYRRIQESGIQQRVNKRIYTEKPKCHVAGGNFVSVGLIDSYPAFLVLGAGIVVSVTLLILEKIVNKNCKRAFIQTG